MNDQGPDPRAVLRYALALVLVALGAAAFAIAFRGILSSIFHAFHVRDVVALFQRFPPWMRIALPIAGGAIAGGVSLATARTGKGHGVGEVMEAVALGGVHLSMRMTLLKSLGSWIATAFGHSIGREGPLIQFGGSLGGLVGGVFGVNERQARVLMAAGTGAGFAAAYNTPLAAVLFVLEIVAGVAALDAVLATVIATAIATTATRAFVGGGPIYGQRVFTLTSSSELAAYFALGLAAGLVAQAFMRLLSAGESLFTRSKIPQPWRAALGGILVGAVAMFLPEVCGNGYEPLNEMLDGAIPFALVVTLLFAKAFATTASVSSGIPGGVFTPTLMLGAAIGLCFHHLLSHFVGPLGGAGAYALVGMAATTAATTHAPMMAAVLVFELSTDYAIVVPLLLATAVATLVSRALRRESIYGAELRRRGLAWELTLEGRLVERNPTTSSGAP